MESRSVLQWLVVLVVLTTTLCSPIPDDLTVHTNTGPVRGIITHGFSGKELVAFYGIPYAQPPVGDLRFKRPLPVKPWTDVLDGSIKPLPCYQQYTFEDLRNAREEHTLIRRPWSEDCLTLNVFVPIPAPEDIPVLVFIHGGGFTTGSNVYSRMEGSPTFATEGKILIVTVNYRLGAFGFLNLDSPEAPGNVGLFDQRLALHWVKDNIHHFGAQTGAVVLAGIGAGGASAGFHVISEGSKDLFKTASVRSGSPTCSWAFHSKEASLKKAHSFAERIGCHDNDNVEETIKCLRNSHPEDIVDAQIADFAFNAHHFRPTVDGEFLKESPLESLKAGRVNKVKALIIVTTANEGSTYLARWNKDVMTGPESEMNRDGFRKAIRRIAPDMSEAGLGITEDFYVDHCKKDEGAAYRDAAMRAYSDRFVDCCVNQFTDLTTAAGLAGFRYVYIQPDIRKPSWMGSVHGVDFEFIFGFPTQGEAKGYTKAENESTIYVMDWIGHHARQTADYLLKRYPLYNLNDRPYTFWTDKQNKAHNYRVQECELWDEILPALKNAGAKCDDGH